MCIEASQSYAEECLAVAFHPSGLHLIVALLDKVQVINIASKGFVLVKNLSIKACSEIQFSNGGHLFACANKTEIHVYNFWTLDCPKSMQYTGHQGQI